jgi:hypothetical protein
VNASGEHPRAFSPVRRTTSSSPRPSRSARVAKAIYGQQAGAAAVLMVNNTDDLPPYEGMITSNADTGEPYLVTIPFFGVRIDTPGAATSGLMALSPERGPDELNEA